MNTEKIATTLRKFIRKHHTKFYELSKRETSLLEMGALVMASEHYRLNGYQVTVQNPRNKLFAVKLSARGNPYNFSWFRCETGANQHEIHSNLAVSGAHRDGSVYVVDVAVVQADVVPRVKPPTAWKSLNNRSLITFAEVKKLVVYPMLLAQFVGIVHEIKPQFLRGQGAGIAQHHHFFPTLISLGYLKGTSRDILQGFGRRRYNVLVVPSFDMHLSRMRRGEAQESPFNAELEYV